jgi:GNAT superfamily N-acetyltransferase
MPEQLVNIRPIALADLTTLVDLDHGYNTDYVWQMDVNSFEKEIRVAFREVRLPRSMYVHYPRPGAAIADTWQKHDLVLVAADEDDGALGYMSLDLAAQPGQVNISDLLVNRILRRKGIGIQLVRAAQQWTRQQGCSQLQMEMQSKNHPTISLAGKLGFDFSGYNDRYYPSGDIALFFTRKLV